MLSILAGFALAISLVYVLLLPVSLPLLAGAAVAGLSSSWLAGRIKIPTHWPVAGVVAGFLVTWLLMILWWVLIQGGGN
jgi:hypothetical protein